MRALRLQVLAVVGCAFMPPALAAQQVKAPPARAFPDETPIIIQGNLNGVVIEGNRRENLNGVFVREDGAVRAAAVRALASQGREYLQVEYHRAWTVCDLNPEQRAWVAGEACAVLRDAMAQVARDSRLRRSTRAGGGTAAGWFQFVEDGLVRAVTAHAGRDQSARHRAELESRDLDRSEAAILLIVAELDRDLFLSARQREQLRAVLRSNWSDVWSIAIDVPDIQGVLSTLLTRHVEPLLSDAQRVSWLQTTTGDNRRIHAFFAGFPENGVVVDEVLKSALAALPGDPDVPGAGAVPLPAR